MLDESSVYVVACLHLNAAKGRSRDATARLSAEVRALVSHTPGNIPTPLHSRQLPEGDSTLWRGSTAHHLDINGVFGRPLVWPILDDSLPPTLAIQLLFLQHHP